MRLTVTAVLSAVAVAVLARLLYGPGVLGYDAVWALRWGDEISDLTEPAYLADFAPTPHPLANLVSAVASLLGPDGATTTILAISWLSLGALAVALAFLGAGLFGWPVGIFAAAVLVTRVQLVAETVQALVDLPFLVLAVSAGALAVRDPRHRAIPWLLLGAGLLRPEGWAIGAAYVLYTRNVRVALIVAAGPVLWAVSDGIVTGDFLHSLHGTQDLGEALGRPTGSRTALSVAPAALRDIVQTPLMWVALGGAAAGLLWRERESVLPGAVVAVGLAGFMVLGTFGLPVLGRYLLLPGVMLLLCAGLAVFGWTSAGDRWWKVGGAVAAAVVLIGIPQDAGDLRDIHRFTDLRHEIQDDLRAAIKAADDDCAELSAPDSRSLAVIRLYRDPGEQAGRVFFTAEDERVLDEYGLGRTGRARPPEDARELYRNDFWRVSVTGPCASSA